MNSCQHQIIENEVCQECGVTFVYLENQNLYSLNHTPQKTVEKSINKELKLIQISDPIKIRANKIYQQISTPTKKGRKRLLLVFYCVYFAYIEKKIVVDPIDITNQLGLKKNAISKALNTFSNCGYDPPMNVVNPVDLIRLYAEKIPCLDKSCIPEIEEFGRDIMEKKPDFGEPFPQKIAGGIIKFYMELNGHALPKKNYEVMLYSSPVTINNVVKEIKTIYNQ